MFLSLGSHWEARRQFTGLPDWAVYLYDRVLRRLPKFPLPRRGAETGIRLRGHPDPFRVRLGATDLLVLKEMFQTGEYTFVEERVRNVERIVDLGSNVGLSLRYWHSIFPAARILAVEPDAANCRLCRRNVEAAGFSHQVKLLQVCVGSHRRKVKLGGADEWAYRMEESSKAEEATIDVVPMDELLDTHVKGRMIDLLKCDIEGAERELFQDCRAWISRVRAIIVELHPPYTTAEFQKNLANSGGRFEVVKEFAEKECPVLLLRSIGEKSAVV